MGRANQMRDNAADVFAFLAMLCLVVLLRNV